MAALSQPVIVGGQQVIVGASVGCAVARPGHRADHVVAAADTAAARGEKGEKVVLVRYETTPDDIHGVLVAQGILTAHGGMTSHAAVVARGLGKPCVSGCEDIVIDLNKETITKGDKVVRKGDTITVDGSAGIVIL